jgi:hypothetical protein
MTKIQGRASLLLKSQKGILTLDFIFAMIMMVCFSAILFAFTITFSAVEIAQYATFAAARAHFAAAKNSDEQETAGKTKFTELVKGPKAPLGMFYRNGWFTLSDVEIKDFNSEYSTDPNKDSDTFIGARTTIVANILKMKFPLLGETTDEDLSATINAYLMREPTEEECVTFTKQRFKGIQSLRPGAFDQGFVNAGSYAFMMDDGC